MSTQIFSDPKAMLRRAALARRRALGPDARQRMSLRIVSEGSRLARLWRPAAISVFHPIRDEPDTLALLAALTGEGFVTALPVTVSRASPLTFRVWRSGDPTVPGEMGIPEPRPDAAAVDPDLARRLRPPRPPHRLRRRAL
jgi:5-formyltetrahydrofolate cyclo-ligase